MKQANNYFGTRLVLLLAMVGMAAGVGNLWRFPVVDIHDQPSMAIEPYMGLPENNPEGYEYGSSLRLAANLKGKLLLIHGPSDVNAPFPATRKMVEALVRAGTYDLIVLPEQPHGFSGTSCTSLVGSHAPILPGTPEQLPVVGRRESTVKGGKFL